MKKKINIGNKIICSLVRMGLFTVCLGVLFFLKFSKDVKAACATAEIFHVHTSDEQTGGGCYTEEILCNGNTSCVTEPLHCGRKGTVINQWEWLCEAGHIEKNTVGGGYYEYPHNVGCEYVVGSKSVFICDTCGKGYSEDTVVCNNIMGYQRTCGFDEHEKVAEITLSADTSRYVHAVKVNTEWKTMHSAVDLQEVTWEWSGNEEGFVECENGIIVNMNGEYTVRVAESDNTTGACASIRIGCIDKEAPVINNSAVIYAEDNSKAILSVEVSDNLSGVLASGYSWTPGFVEGTGNSVSYSDNGNYRVFVYDVAGNMAVQEFTVDGIVKPATTVENADVNPAAPIENADVNPVEREDNMVEEVQDKIKEEYDIENEHDLKEKPDEIVDTKEQVIVQEEYRMSNAPVFIRPQPVEIKLSGKKEEDIEEKLQESGQEVVQEPVNLEPDIGVLGKTTFFTGDKAAGYIGIIIGVSAILTSCYMLFAKGRCLLHNEKKSDKITMNIN